MNLKYSKFDFNKNDISLFFIFFIYYFIFYFFIDDTHKYIIVIVIILTVYLLYRIIIIYFLKKFTRIAFKSSSIEIKNIFLKKTIEYKDIKNITIRKNYLGSKDIIINFDDTINIYRYFCNYVVDISIRKKHKNSYIICDLKNSKEIEKIMLEKICDYKTSCTNVIFQILYIKHSLLESQFAILGILFINICIISLIFSFLKPFLIIYLIFINVKFFKTKYYLKKPNNKIMKISDSRKLIYLFDDYDITETEVRIDYGLKINFNYYYLSSDILPIKYKISRICQKL